MSARGIADRTSWTPAVHGRPCVLITGASGFVGRSLCAMLHDLGWLVIATTRRTTDVPGADTIAQLALGQQPADWRRVLTGVDCVVHLAGRVHQMGTAAKDEQAFSVDNVEGSRFLAEASADVGVRRFVYISSIKVNGEATHVKPFAATDRPAPQDAYARSKLAAETAIQNVCETGDMEYVCIRPPLVYGRGVGANFARLIALSRTRLPLPFGAIKNARSLVYVDNLCDLIRLSLTHPSAAGRTWLVSDGEDLSTPELLRRLAQLQGFRPTLLNVPPAVLIKLAPVLGATGPIARLCGSLRVDGTPAREELGWRPPLTVNQGLERTVTDA